MKFQLGLRKFLSTFFYLVIIASNHKSHRLFIWPWHLDQPIINWFDLCFFISIYPHKNVYTGQLMMKDWCTHSMAIRNVGPRWQDKKRCCKSQSAFRCNKGPGVDHRLPPPYPPPRAAGAVSRPPQKLEILSKIVRTIGFGVMYAFFKCVSGAFLQASTQYTDLEWANTL